MIMSLISTVAGSFGQTNNELPMQRVTLTKRYFSLRLNKEMKKLLFTFEQGDEEMHIFSGGISALLSLL